MSDDNKIYKGKLMGEITYSKILKQGYEFKMNKLDSELDDAIKELESQGLEVIVGEKAFIGTSPLPRQWKPIFTRKKIIES